MKETTISLHFCMENCIQSKHDHGSWISQRHLVWKYCYPPYFTDREVQSTCKSGTCRKTLLYPAACPCWQSDVPQFPKLEELWGPLYWWRTRGKQMSFIFYQEMIDSWSSEHSHRVLLLILELDGGSEILNLFCLLSDLWLDHVMVLKLSALVKESCKYLFSPHSSCGVISTTLCFQSPSLESFFLSYCQEGRHQHENSTEQGVPCRATGAVSMTWDSSEPKTRSKWKCWEIQMYSLFSDNFTPHQPAALQPTLSTQSRRHIPHRQVRLEIATLYREWVWIGEKN